MIINKWRKIRYTLLTLVVLLIAIKSINSSYIVHFISQPQTLKRQQSLYTKIQLYILKARAKLGDRAAQTNLGIILADVLIPSTPAHDQAAVALWKKAARKHSPQAQYELALAYTYGVGTKKDFSQAQKYMTQAAQGKFKLAQCITNSKSSNLDELYVHIDTCRLQRDAKAGLPIDPNTLAELGLHELLSNNPKSIQVLKQADRDGSLLASKELAVAYAFGLTVEANFNKAKSYLNKAAAHNDAMALAVMHQKPHNLAALRKAINQANN